MLSLISKELRLICYCGGLYVTFMLWAFLQERITSTKYSVGDEQLFWKFPVALNLAMAAAAYCTSVVIESVRGEPVEVPVKVFWYVTSYVRHRYL
jgi:hypothetical protein